MEALKKEYERLFQAYIVVREIGWECENVSVVNVLMARMMAIQRELYTKYGTIWA